MKREGEFWIKDVNLADVGELKIEWAERHMPVCMKVREKLRREKPLAGMRLSMCLHVTKETAVLVETVRSAGAEVALSASNPLSTQDEVAAALVKRGVAVYAFKGQDTKEYYQCIAMALSHGPHITVDDGADLTTMLHRYRHSLSGQDVEYGKEVISGHAGCLDHVIGGTEETTTGVIRLKALKAENLLLYPVIAVNDTPTKNLFDNPIGTGQSALDGILRATNVLIAGKRVVVAGYGQVGSGIANRVRGLGADVIVVEAHPVRALMAAMNGFKVATMREAAKLGDIFITATGNRDVIRREHMELMKDGALLANAGHYDVEISKKDLASLSEEVREISPFVKEYRLRDGRKLYLLADGRLVNLVAAEGHPSEVMDLSFALQALSIEYVAKNHNKLERDVLPVPESIDLEVAREKLRSMGMDVEELTEEQKKYLADWRLGT